MNRSGEDPGKLREIRPHRGHRPAGCRRCAASPIRTLPSDTRDLPIRAAACTAERTPFSTATSPRASSEVEAHALDADVSVGENGLDRHPFEDPQIPRRLSSGGKGERGQRAALEDREDRRDGGVVPGEGEKLPAQRRHVEAAAAGGHVDPRARAAGGECDLREKPGRLRGKPRERDRLSCRPRPPARLRSSSRPSRGPPGRSAEGRGTKRRPARRRGACGGRSAGPSRSHRGRSGRRGSSRCGKRPPALRGSRRPDQTPPRRETRRAA